MTRLHWLCKAGLLEPSELGNIPFISLRTLELGRFVSSEDNVMARMIELMPALEVLVADLGSFGEKAIKAVCDKENQAWTNSVNGYGVQVCHLQEIVLTNQKEQSRMEQTDGLSNNSISTPLGDLLTHCRPSSPVVGIVDEEDEAEFKALLVHNVTRLKNIRILGLPGAIWMQLIRDVNKNKWVEQQRQPHETTWSLLDLVRLQEIDVLLDKMSNPWGHGYRDVFEYLHSDLRRMVPNLRRLSYDGEVNELLVDALRKPVES
ncbi:hypothetical protein BGZ91_011196 [Linnemannia elongata]|nr:hypothetical protein BGZ91_011196 [Linnemannia elongata]